MPKRSRSVEPDENQSAFGALQRIIETTEAKPEKNPAAVELGRRGGLKGGRARADKLTPEERKASASAAAQARWREKR